MSPAVSSANWSMVNAAVPAVVLPMPRLSKTMTLNFEARACRNCGLHVSIVVL
jgi:hypothetical protein